MRCERDKLQINDYRQSIFQMPVFQGLPALYCILVISERLFVLLMSFISPTSTYSLIQIALSWSFSMEEIDFTLLFCFFSPCKLMMTGLPP